MAKAVLFHDIQLSVVIHIGLMMINNKYFLEKFREGNSSFPKMIFCDQILELHIVIISLLTFFKHLLNATQEYLGPNFH